VPRVMKGVKVFELLLAVVIPTSVMSKTPQNIKQAVASTAFASSSAATRGILGQQRNPQERGVENRWGDTVALLAGLRLGASGTSSPAGARQQRVTQGARAAAPGGVLQLHSSAAGQDTGSRLRPLNKAIHEDAGVCARKAWHSRRGLLPKDVKSLEAAQHLMQQGACSPQAHPSATGHKSYHPAAVYSLLETQDTIYIASSSLTNAQIHKLTNSHKHTLSLFLNIRTSLPPTRFSFSLTHSQSTATPFSTTISLSRSVCGRN